MNARLRRCCWAGGLCGIPLLVAGFVLTVERILLSQRFWRKVYDR